MSIIQLQKNVNEILDSGTLKLYKENIPNAPFLNDNVSMYSTQAREGERS